MPRINVTVPDRMDEQIETLVDEGVFSTKSAVVEEGLRMALMKYSRFRYDELGDAVGDQLFGP